MRKGKDKGSKSDPFKKTDAYSIISPYNCPIYMAGASEVWLEEKIQMFGFIFSDHFLGCWTWNTQM